VQELRQADDDLGEDNWLRCSAAREGDAMSDAYSHFLHRHNFAVWAAARAAQRGFAPTAVIKNALEASGLPNAVEQTDTWPKDHAAFDDFHRQHCRRIMESLETASVPAVTYGRAAKVVAVYLKSMIVVGPHWAMPFARLVHPPIDRILLRNVASDKRLPRAVREACKKVNWTKLSEDQYFQLIAGFRHDGLDKPAFWMLERYWSVALD